MPYFAASDLTKIYYEDTGNGETILFAHGLGSSHFELKPFIDHFRKDYRCVCYDHRGHGASEHPKIHMNVKRLGQDMHELIEYLGLKDITLIGHSMGAATIFSYVNQFVCGKLKRIVDVDMTPYMRNTVWEGGPERRNAENHCAFPVRYARKWTVLYGDGGLHQGTCEG